MIVGFDASRISAKNKTGAENYSENLLHWFKKLDRGDFLDGGKYHNGYIVYKSSSNSMEFLDLPRNFALKEILIKKLWTQVGLTRELSKTKPDLLFAPSQSIPFYNYGVKTVATIHDVAFKYFPDQYSFLDRNILDIMTQSILKRSEKVITLSQTTKDDLIKFYGAEEEKIYVIYPGFEPPKKSAFHISEGKWEKMRDKFGIIRKYLLYVGRIETRKNLTTLIKAFYEVLSSGQELQLVLAGRKGVGYEKVLALIEKFNLKDRVILTGYVNEEEKNYLLRNAELFVFLSRYEGFGLPVLEAFYYELPVIASRIPIFEELYSNAVVLVNPYESKEVAEAIISTVKNNRRKDSLAAKGKELLTKFSWERAAKETLELLNSFEPDKKKIFRKQ